MSFIITLPDSLVENWSKELSIEKTKLVNVLSKENKSICLTFSSTTTLAISFLGSQEVSQVVSTSTSVSKSIKKSTESEIHKCERIPRGRKDKCGKNAKNSITYDDGSVKWFCGSKKSGCYKSAFGAVERNGNKKGVQKPTKAKENMLENIAVQKKNNYNVEKLIVDGKEIFINREYRVVFNSTSQKAIGMLDDKNKIVPFDEKAKSWMLTNNVEEEDYNHTSSSEVEAIVKEESEEEEEETEDILGEED